MPNHLVVPFKKTYTAPIRSSVRDYILHHTEDHPDAYRSDIAQWESLRVACMNTTTAHHSSDVDAFLKYHAQLVFVLAKLPSDINLEISYAHPFSTSSSIPVTLRSLAFERASVLFNLAALYSQLAAAEDRSSQDGLRRATTYYQSAAGTLSYLSSSALPKLRFPANAEEIPTDLTEPFVRCLENLMLAQAQECAWQRAVADHYKNALIAKLATGVAFLYASSLEAIRSAPSTISSSLPSTCMTHVETKERHFRAAAQYRKSIDELEANRYGDELRRLMDAEVEAKKGYSLVKRSSVAPAVIQDIKSLLDVLQKNLGRAQRDNDLIYHCDIPASTAIDPIPEVIMVKSNVPPGLLDPKSLIGTDGILFGDMLGWGAREAVNIYNDNKRTLVKERVVETAQVLDDEAERLLRSLNLPASLEALERPIGLPPSLLKKAEEVRLEQGPERIEAYLDDVQHLARRAMSILDEARKRSSFLTPSPNHFEQAMDILDNEASEDEAARKQVSMSRPLSHEANRELVAKEQRYRSILLEAAQSDLTVREKWEESEAAIVNLTLDEEELEALVPSTTVSIDGKISRANNQTQIHARALRGLLESLDDIRKDRSQVVARAQRRVEVDDIKPSIISVASNVDRWEELTPAMFVDLSDKELAKYDRFIQELAEGKKNQEGILEAIKSKNEQFLLSRKEDPAVKDREVVLHRLDMAHAKYLEITRNLDEGRKFYNEMASILSRFKEACKLWSNQRSQEAQSFYQSFKSLSIQEGPRLPSQRSPDEPAETSTAEQPSPQRHKANIPPLSSAEWEPQDFPPVQRPIHTPSWPKQKANLPSLSSPEWEAQEPPQTPGGPAASPSRPKKKANLLSLSSPEWKTEGLVSPPSPEPERQKPSMTLPSLSSAEWETQELPPPPPPTERRGAKTPRKQRR
ncbi:BRO1-like domain-containing protein [Pisolithus croceorrhizus]|nr:BRO1-like domain-containing protein [Pisolithus croceorrhizus]